MKARLHLICAPWAHPAFPSIQLGALKAYVDSVFGGDVETHAYSAHLGILYHYKQFECFNLFAQFACAREDVYFAVYYRRYLSERLSARDRLPLSGLLRRLNRRNRIEETSDLPDRTDVAQPITAKLVRELERATTGYLDREVIPKLDPASVNVIGLTLNYDQLYASMFIARYLEEAAPGVPKVFLWGGYAAAAPHESVVMRELGIPGFRVIGEGEKKLESVLRGLLALPDGTALTADVAREALSGIAGVVAVDDASVDPYLRDERAYRGQFEDISKLPLPDYDEYFGTVARLGAEDPIFERWLRSPRLIPGMYRGVILEGTRGCFGRCDFCSMNAVWAGFRKLSAEAILERARALSERYGTKHVRFTDNVCDTWAEKFAEELIRSGEGYAFFLSLRAHHPEKFWTKLRLAGMTTTQIGVEALGSELLKGMAKGTLVIQNLTTQKYLSELGINHEGNNLITYHPRSTLKDIEETRSILELTPHFGRYRLSTFWFSPGSPLYESLTPEQRHRCEPTCAVPLPKALRRYVVEYGFEVPEALAPPREVVRGWDEFKKWYGSFVKSLPESCELRVERLGEGRLRIVDRRRSSAAREIVLEGLGARAYDLCHQGLRLDALAQRLGLPRERVCSALDPLLRQRVLLEVEGFYLSLALRPLEELVANLGPEAPRERRERAPEPSDLSLYVR